MELDLESKLNFILLVRLDVDTKDEESIRIKEQTILELARLLSKGKQVKGIVYITLPA